MHLDISTTREGRAAVVVLAGRFDAHEADPVIAVLDDLIRAGAIALQVDLTKVDFIDSTGLAVLTRYLKRMREHGGDLVLVAPSAPVRVILELTALDRAFTVTDSGGDPGLVVGS